MKRNQQLEAVLEELRAAGVKPRGVRQNGHIYVHWQVPGKEVRMCVVAHTSRSATGVLNARATVRRMLRQDGVLR